MKYNIIYADPPWTYRDKCNAGERGACHKYDVMSIDDICDLNVPAISDDNSVLFLWATWPLLQEALYVMLKWGFAYKTIGFVWVKTTKKAHEKLWSASFYEWLNRLTFMGMGNWSRSNSEPCLMGIRGKPKRASASVKSTIIAPIGEHSAKPPETRDRIVQLCGDLPRAELFARDKTLGWDVWGNEIESDLMLTKTMGCKL